MGDLVAWFLTSFSKDNEVSVLLELLPKLLPTIKSSASVVSALQCLGKHGQREAALQCFSLLKKKGTHLSFYDLYVWCFIYLTTFCWCHLLHLPRVPDSYLVLYLA